MCASMPYENCIMKALACLESCILHRHVGLAELTSTSLNWVFGGSGFTDGIPTSPLLKLHTFPEAW
jgi:hypothetical protein